MIADEVGITKGWGEIVRCKATDTPEVRERKNMAFEIVETLKKKGLSAWDACVVVDYARNICKESLKYATITNPLETPAEMTENFKNPPAH